MQFLYKDTCLVAENDILKVAKSLGAYINEMKAVKGYDAWEGSINLPSDEALLEEVEKMKKEKKSRALKYVVVVGIGGSNLGTKAIYDALYGQFDLLETDRFPKMYFADTNDPKFLTRFKTFLKRLAGPEEVLVNMVSKSGTSTETVVNAEVLIKALRDRFQNKALDRLVLTTGQGSKLWQAGEKHGISKLTIPEKIGGRFSVLSAVGLFPLAICGIDIKKLRQGAQTMRELCFKDDLLENPAAASAAILYQHSKKGKTINDNFIFHAELESLGKWYRQLMGEGLGKDGKGITPTVSIGSTDLHSVGQLYLGGPKDKITTFISSEVLGEIAVPEDLLFFGLVPGIRGKRIHKIMSAMFQGARRAYKKQKLPFTEVWLDDITPRSLGEFLQFKMLEIMYLGKLMGVNAFNEPQVELYKKEVRKILGS